MIYSVCGEWGIRTPDTCNTYTAFRVRLFRPLRQLSFGIVLFYWKLSCSRLVNKGFKRKVRDFCVIPRPCKGHPCKVFSWTPINKKEETCVSSFSFLGHSRTFLRKVRDSNPRFSYKPFWCCFLLLNSGLIFQIFTFVHTGFTRCLHDFFTLEKLCKGTKNSWHMQIFWQLFSPKNDI